MRWPVCGGGRSLGGGRYLQLPWQPKTSLDRGSGTNESLTPQDHTQDNRAQHMANLTTRLITQLLSGQPWRRLRSSLGLSELLCILPPDFFSHVTQTTLAGSPHSTLSRAELRPSTYIIYGLTTSETIYVLCKPVYLAHQHLPFGLELRYASSQFTDGARDHQVPEEVPELDPRLLGRETRRFQGQEDGIAGFVLLLNTPMTNGFWISKISHFSDSKKVVACMQEMDATPRTEGRQPATPMHAALVIWNHFNTTTHSAVLSHLQRLPSSPWLVTRIHVKHFSKVSSVQLSRIVCSAPSRHTTMRFELPCTSYREV
ncbi:unnamed protein product [Fusarium fujikuroi]|uniref:Uncharacterized protein n=1 Tax=Fusarium fujikuroi TaxID=5127 RepID=A0A9Q9RUE6_FUSFU|nr:unnamed protein product [Fusarium fujikuroi]